MSTILRQGRLQEAVQLLETARTKNSKTKRRDLLKQSVASTQMFLATNPQIRDWDSAALLSNLTLSIANGLEDGEIIPAEDIGEYEQAVLDLDDRYHDHLTMQDDLEESAATKVVTARKRVDEINKTLKASQMGLKALALVSGDINKLIASSEDDQNEERIVQASLNKMGSRNTTDKAMRDEDYVRLVHQMENIEPYLLKMKNQLPRTMDERFVVLRQPVLVVGNYKKPSARALNFIAHYGIEMGGYYILKNQLVLGVARDAAKVARNPKFRKATMERLRAIYKEELEYRIEHENLSRNTIQRLKMQMEKRLSQDLEEEIESMTKQVDVKSIIKDLSRRMGHEVVQMEGSARVMGSPYTYYWLSTTDTLQNVVNGLYSELTNWDLPYNT